METNEIEILQDEMKSSEKQMLSEDAVGATFQTQLPEETVLQSDLNRIVVVAEVHEPPKVLEKKTPKESFRTLGRCENTF